MSAAVLVAPSVVVVIGGALILILIAVGGTQVFTSTRRAKDHLAKATAFAPPAPATPAGAPTAGSRSGSPPDANANGDASQQIFAQLTQYYAANISQGQAIFWASFVSMVVGFAIVFAGIVSAGLNSTTAIVAGVAGVLGQFIAATFLVALRSTQEQSTSYAQSLVELRVRDLRAADDAQAVALGLQLLGDISGSGATALANQTRAALAMGLIVKQAPPAAPVVSVPVVVDDPKLREPSTAPRRRAPSVTFDETANDVGAQALGEA